MQPFSGLKLLEWQENINQNHYDFFERVLKCNFKEEMFVFKLFNLGCTYYLFGLFRYFYVFFSICIILHPEF